ncbi:MAG: amino acid adenylation domain-containing protein, partial [Desulfovibrionaceae bacterium]
LRLGPDRHILFVCLHHLVADGWSVSVLLTDLARAWTTDPGDGRLPALPAPSPRHRDWAAWSLSRRETPAARARLDFWRAELADLPEPLDLPADRPRPALQDFAGAALEFALPEALAEGLRRLGAETGLFPALAAVTLALLHRLTGRQDMILGVPTAGRHRPELEPLVGLFVNTLPLRGRVDPDEPFAALLTRTARTWAAALEQEAPFEDVVDAVRPRRDPGRNPLFDVLLVLQNTPPVRPDLPGLDAERLALPMHACKTDLNFAFEERDGRLFVQIEYATALFDPERMARLRDAWLTLTTSALAGPDRGVGALDLLPEAEQWLVLEDFNATDFPHPADATAPALFAERARRDPGAPALADHDGTVLTFGELAARADALAARLAARGVRRGDLVGVCAARGVAMMTGIFGILRAGAVYLPLDPALPPARLAQVLEDARAGLVLAGPESLETARGLSAAVLPLNVDILPLDAAAWAPCDAPPPPRPEPGDAAYAIFTSGSTGRPKGVVIEHRALANRLLWMQSAFPLAPDDTLVQKTPVSFDVSIWELFWWALAGARLALPAPGAERDPAALLDAVEANRVTVIHFVPSMLRAFLDWIESGRGDAARAASLRRIFASGEALPRDLAERCARLLPAAALHNLYGPTEATVDVTWEPCDAASLAAARAAGETGPVPIGRPVHNTRCYVLDPAGRPAPLGVWGELWLGGVQVARGYLHRPELTAERFRPDPFLSDSAQPRGRMYRTGDRCRWRADGRIEYGGRLDAQVKIRGQRIEPGEVEAA